MPRVDVSHLYVVCTRAIEAAIDGDGDSCATTIHIEVVVRSIVFALYQLFEFYTIQTGTT